MTPALVDEVTAVLTAHRALAHRLAALAEVSAAQARAGDAESWEAALARKAVLLEELDRCDTGALAARTREVHATLLREGRHEVAERLRRAQAANERRYAELAAAEDAAQHRLQAQVAALREALQGATRRGRVRAAYRPAGDADARFLDRKQ